MITDARSRNQERLAQKKSGLEGRSENGLLMSGSYIKMIKAELGCRGWTGTATSQFG